MGWAAIVPEQNHGLEGVRPHFPLSWSSSPSSPREVGGCRCRGGLRSLGRVTGAGRVRMRFYLLRRKCHHLVFQSRPPFGESHETGEMQGKRTFSFSPRHCSQQTQMWMGSVPRAKSQAGWWVSRRVGRGSVSGPSVHSSGDGRRYPAGREGLTPAGPHTRAWSATGNKNPVLELGSANVLWKKPQPRAEVATEQRTRLRARRPGG